MVWTNWRLPKGCWLHSIFSQKIHFVSPFPLAGTPTARMPFSSVILSGILFIRNPDWLERRNFKIVPRSIQLEASCSEQHNLPRPCSRSKFDFFKRSVFFFSFSILFLFFHESSFYRSKSCVSKFGFKLYSDKYILLFFIYTLVVGEERERESAIEPERENIRVSLLWDKVRRWLLRSTKS